jgi:hypothetical protein
MHDDIAPCHGLGDGVRITDVALHESVLGVARYRLQVCKISGIGQFVEVDDAVVYAERKHMLDKVRANESCPTCNEDFH